MDYSMPGFPVWHQTHVHQVGDAIQSSYPLSSPSLAFNLSQHQGLFQWVSSLHQVAKISASASVLPMNAQDWSLLDGLIGSLCSPRDSQESSPVRRECYSSIHVWACLFWKLNSVLRAQLERPADTCTQLQSRVQPQWLRPLHCRPHSRAAPGPGLVWSCPSQPDRCLPRPAGLLWPPLPASFAQPPVQDPLILPWLRWPLRPGAESSGQRRILSGDWRGREGRLAWGRNKGQRMLFRDGRWAETPVLNGKGRKQGKHGPLAVCCANDWHQAVSRNSADFAPGSRVSHTLWKIIHGYDYLWL